MQAKNIVDSIIATFAVFTGFTLNGRLEKFPLTGFDDKNLWLFVILATLLLRFIIGSAAHLNRTYVNEVPGKDRPPSRSAGLLFKDLVFLVMFGIVAVKMKEADAVGVLHWAAWFLVAALTWVLVDYPLRAACAKRWNDEYEYAPPDVSLSWAGIDIVQGAVTLIVIDNWEKLPPLPTVVGLAAVYTFSLLLDFLVLFYKRPWVA